MDSPAEEIDWGKKKNMEKQLTGKRDDTSLHSAARAGDLERVSALLSAIGDQELENLITRQNQSGETAMYVASKCGYVEIVKELLRYYSTESAGIRANNGYDAFHVAAKQGHLQILQVLMEAIPELVMTVDHSNTTALHSAASQGHHEVVDLLMENGDGLLSISKQNGKTALHSASRNGHLEVVKALLRGEPGPIARSDKKGQTALHMAVKGQNLEVVHELIEADPTLVNITDSKGNTALHIAARKGRIQIITKLLSFEGTGTDIINRNGDTALDTADKSGVSEIKSILEELGAQRAKSIQLPPQINTVREFKQTMSDIKHEIHDQQQQTWKTRKHVKGMAKRVNKMHVEGLNNAINSTTVVAVLIATVAFAAIFTLPGQYADDVEQLSPGNTLGAANIAPRTEFIVFFITDSLALFISLAVVVVQTSVVAVQKKAKKKMMAVMNKLMWMACVMVSVAFLALSYIIVGDHQKGLAIAVTGIGTVIMAATLGTMCYWVVGHRIEATRIKSMQRSTMSRSQSRSVTMMSDQDLLTRNFKPVYAI